MFDAVLEAKASPWGTERGDVNHTENVSVLEPLETAVQRLINAPQRQVLPNMEIQPACRRERPRFMGTGWSRFTVHLH